MSIPIVDTLPAYAGHVAFFLVCFPEAHAFGADITPADDALKVLPLSVDGLHRELPLAPLTGIHGAELLFSGILFIHRLPL
jgi:hypothetical protein